jgi:peptidoglycan hydrolase-like protein with peptidoglycan-binding domain
MTDARRSRWNWRAVGGAAVAVVAAVALGAGVAAAVLTPARPAVLASPEAIESVPVATQSFDDRRSVTVGFALGSGTSLTSPGDGRITSFDCARGASFVSGESALSLDGRPVLTLASEVPLWRDLTKNDRGDDVAALQRELARLGEPVTVDGVLGRETLDALERRFRSIGDVPLPEPTWTAPDDATTEARSVVLASRILWIPSPMVIVDECAIGTGATTTAGEPLATLGAGLSAVAVEQMPGDLVPGERALVVDGAALPVQADGTVTDAAALAAIASSSSVREATLGEATTFTATLDLVDPVEIAVVPPSAVAGVDGTTGCVIADGALARVDIVGSQLGQTLVRFAEGAAIPAAVAVAPPETMSCG